MKDLLSQRLETERMLLRCAVADDAPAVNGATRRADFVTRASMLACRQGMMCVCEGSPTDDAGPALRT